jgi:aspartyl protease family protein
VSSTFSFGQNNSSKNDFEFIENKGWIITKFLNSTFSATFFDDFKSKESIKNWDLGTETGGSSNIENEMLNMTLYSKGRIRVPITEAPMDLSKNNFDIISVFDKSSSSLYQGVIFGYKDSRNYSSITFSSKLKMMVYEKNEDGILTGDDQKNGIYAIPDYDNELRIKKEKDIIVIYFNGVKTYEINETNQPGNGVGVIAGGNETMNQAFVKYFSANILLPDELTFGLDKKVNFVKVKKSNGVFSVPVELNGVLKIDFIFDSGASDVSISTDVALTLLKTGTIKKEDWLDGAYYKFADGSTAKSKRFRMSSIKIGNKIIKNVTCSISNSIDAPMLLGQSVLSKFGKYTFDNVNQKLIID